MSNNKKFNIIYNIKLTDEDLEYLKTYLSYLPDRVTKAKEDLKQIDRLLKKLNTIN